MLTQSNHLSNQVINDLTCGYHVTESGQVILHHSGQPINWSSTIKVTLFSPGGKESAMFKFSNIHEAMNFIRLNEPPRYMIWG